MHVTGQNTPGAQRAELMYRVIRPEEESGRAGDRESPCRARNLTLLPCCEVRPLTGRKHQIRLQLSHAGFPIVGDRKYGSSRPFPAGIALHSRRLVIEHPVSKMQLEIEAPLPASWQRYLGAGRASPQALDVVFWTICLLGARFSRVVRF